MTAWPLGVGFVLLASQERPGCAGESPPVIEMRTCAARAHSEASDATSTSPMCATPTSRLLGATRPWQES